MDNSKTPLQKTKVENESDGLNGHSPTLPPDINEIERQRGLICPNCGSALQNRKCKLLCVRPGCGYLVTCSEW
jgi:hypothetical protein